MIANPAEVIQMALFHQIASLSNPRPSTPASWPKMNAQPVKNALGKKVAPPNQDGANSALICAV